MIPHFLLTTLGVQVRKTTYQWQDQTVTASLAPVALVQLLEPCQRPGRVVAVVTAQARKEVWPTFQQEMHQALGFEPDPPVEVPAGRSHDEIQNIMGAVAQCFPQDAATELTLDVTHGLRHFPFIIYALVLYLRSLRAVKVRGAYYGMLEGIPEHESKPIIDLKPLLELPDWFHAVQMFRDQGTTLPMAPLIRPVEAALRQEAQQLQTAADPALSETGRETRSPRAIERYKQARQVKGAVDSLNQYAFAYESALPLELGKAGQWLIESIQHLATTPLARTLPLTTELTQAIAEAAQPVAFTVPLSPKGKWKTTVSLDKAELDRQARMIDLYFNRSQLPLAVGLMREWVVSWALWKSDQPQDGLVYATRKRFERRLGALGAVAKDPAFTDTVTPDHRAFGNFWNQLTDERNTLHHHAMREDALEEPPHLETIRNFWKQLRSGHIDLPSWGGSGGRLLVSPQGTRSGVLFSALKAVQPDRCLVICSAASASSIPRAATQAAFTGCTWPVELADPHGGLTEINEVAAQVRQWLLEADEVVINMTGGTTLMGLIVQRLAEEAQKLDRSVRRFALIDRRPPAQQDAEPFVQGDCYWLDPESL
ncbi:hypothetical protein NKDENANG_00755 [Candidatus Entotheonellaceae bacterium PAL068K]